MKFGLAFIAASLATIGTPSLAAGTRRAAEITAAAAEDARVLDDISDLEALLNKLSETIKLPADASSLSNIDIDTAAATTAEEGQVVANAFEDFKGASYFDAVVSFKEQVAVLITTLQTTLAGCDGMEGAEMPSCRLTAFLVFKAGVWQSVILWLGLFGSLT